MNALRASLLLILAGGLWLALSAFANEPRIRIKSPGIAAGAPADWAILVTLDPRPEHRKIAIEAIGEPGEYRSSEYDLPGEKSWRIRQFWFKRLPEGCYTFAATVADNSDILARVESQRLAVIGHSGYPCPQPFSGQ